MANERVFPKGVMCFKPHQSAPAFVKGSVVITLNDLIEWCKGDGAQYLTEYNHKKQIRLQITENKNDGKYSIAVDTWKPNSGSVTESTSQPVNERGKKEEPFKVEDEGDTLPF